MRWIRVHKLPDYAYFAHNAHLAAGIGCVTCHGRIDEMETVTQMTPLSMSWCLDCHRNPGPNRRPVSEVTNMKWNPPARHPEARGATRSRTTGPSADRVFGVPPVSRTYWRSLAQIEDRPEFRDALEREFPEGASELPEGMTRRDMMMLARRLAVARGHRGVPAPGRRDRPLCHRSGGDRSRHSPPLRDDDAVPPERVRPDRREPRGATDQDRGKPVAPVDSRGLELARPGIRARPLQSRPLAVGHAAGRRGSPGAIS